MATVGERLWESLDKWSATVFLVAGALWVVATALSLLEAFLATSMQGPSSVAGFTGAVLTFVGLAGLYPRLAGRTHRLAKAGLLLILFPLIFTFVLLVWHIPPLFVEGWPSLLVYLPSPSVIYGALFFLSAVGITTFGVVGLRTDALPGDVGALLLVVAAAWYLLLGAAVVSAPGPLPEWVTDVQGAMFALGLLGVGYLLRTESEPSERSGGAADAPA